MSRLETESAEAPSEIDTRRTESPIVDVEKSSEHTDDAGPKFERNIHGIKWAMTVAAVLSCVFLYALDTTVVADIQPEIISSLGEFQKFPWLVTAYALPACALVLIQSKLYGLFDIKWLYFGYVVCFEIGSAISGAAPTMNSLIVGRMIAGIGGCGIYVGSLTFFSVVTTPTERPMYISLISPTWGIGTVLGPVVGGGFAESSVGWRWGFYINLVIFAAAAPVLIFILPSIDFAKGQSTKQRLSKIDWLGLTVWTGWCISFFMAITFGGTLFEWDSYSMIILWVFTGVLAIGFILTHKLHPFIPAEDRLYPAHMLRNFKLGILQFATFAAAAAVYIPIYYIPLYFQFARGESPVEAAIKLLPFVFMIVTVAILNGIVMSRTGYFMPWFLVGAILAVIGGALMYTVTISTSTSAIYGYSVILGIGGGCFMITAFGCISAVVQPKDMFNAIGVVTLVQCLGITFFPAIGGGIFQNIGANYVAPYLPSEFTGNPRVILAGASSPEFQSFPEDVQAQLAAIIVDAMSNNYLMTIVASGLTVLISPFLGRTRDLFVYRYCEARDYAPIVTALHIMSKPEESQDGGLPSSTSQTSSQLESSKKTNGHAARYRKVYGFFGFNRGYNFPLWIIFAGGMLGFCLSRLPDLDYDNHFKNEFALIPGYWYYFNKGHYRYGMIIHLAAVLPAGILVVLQFTPVIRHKLLLFHRINGYTIILLFLISNAAAFVVIRHPQGGGHRVTARAAESWLGIITTIGLFMAWWNIRRKQIDQHRAWMLRTMFYFGVTITARLINLAALPIITRMGHHYAVWSCDEIQFLYDNLGAPFPRDAYPHCFLPDGSLDRWKRVAVDAQENIERPEQIGAGATNTFGTMLWICFIIHAVGVELYLAMTPRESERLRRISYEKQVEAGYAHPGSAGLVLERWGDADAWTPPPKQSNIP
ncbi:major facilitator superfamily permease [Paramyrothecium foliicola]|nr:major facilitator superfamily permease [Paramyrothecium foliicola]